MPTRQLRTPAPGMCWQNQTGLLHHRPRLPKPQCHPDGHRLHLWDSCSGPRASPSPAVSQWSWAGHWARGCQAEWALRCPGGAPGTQEGRLTSGVRGGWLSRKPARGTLPDPGPEPGSPVGGGGGPGVWTVPSCWCHGADSRPCEGTAPQRPPRLACQPLVPRGLLEAP